MACHDYDVVACYFDMLMINEMYWFSSLLSFDWCHIWHQLLCSKLLASCISSVQSLDRLACRGDNYDKWFSSDSLPVVFCRRPLWAVLALAGMLTLWCWPSSISSADHGVAHPPRCPEEWFRRSCRSVWHTQTMQASVSWQLPDEVQQLHNIVAKTPKKTLSAVDGTAKSTSSWTHMSASLAMPQRHPSASEDYGIRALDSSGCTTTSAVTENVHTVCHKCIQIKDTK